MHDEAYKRIMEQAAKKMPIHAEGVQPVDAYGNIQHAASKPNVFDKVHEKYKH